ncbi:MAG: hypothetical protein KKD01_20045 [Proteobacteria bacterium]|nr:hypothetical protein [Pseudomonadota bacterium]MBU1457012.1 hypothetical protein [Pseudomonadota bacterium]
MQLKNKLLADLSVSTTKIQDSAVDTLQVNNLAITAAKLAEDAVVASKIADLAVIGSHLNDSAKQAVLEYKFFAYPVAGAGFVVTPGATSDNATDFIFSRSTSQRTGGYASGVGIITTPPNNKVFLREVNSNDTVQTSNNEEIYGRSTSVVTALTGLSTWTQGSATILGSGTIYTSQLAVGDWIKLDSNGQAYKIANIASDSELTLESIYTGTTGSGGSSQEELIISYYIDVNGTETAHAMPGITIDIMFSEVFNLLTAPFNAPLVMVGFAEILSSEHHHDTRYRTQNELASTANGSSGASLIGVDSTTLPWTTATNLQALLEAIDAAFSKFSRHHAVAVTATNVLANLPYTPANSVVMLTVSGLPQSPTDYTVVGKVLTWIPANAGFSLETTDEVHAFYQSTD